MYLLFGKYQNHHINVKQQPICAFHQIVQYF